MTVKTDADGRGLIKCPRCKAKIIVSSWQMKSSSAAGLRSHERRCAFASAEERAFYKKSGHWPGAQRNRGKRF